MRDKISVTLRVVALHNVSQYYIHPSSNLQSITLSGNMQVDQEDDLLVMNVKVHMANFLHLAMLHRCQRSGLRRGAGRTWRKHKNKRAIKSKSCSTIHLHCFQIQNTRLTEPKLEWERSDDETNVTRFER